MTMLRVEIELFDPPHPAPSGYFCPSVQNFLWPKERGTPPGRLQRLPHEEGLQTIAPEDMQVDDFVVIHSATYWRGGRVMARRSSEPSAGIFYVSTCSTKPADGNFIFPGPYPQNFYTLQSAIDFARRGWALPGGVYCVYQIIDGGPKLLWKQGDN